MARTVARKRKGRPPLRAIGPPCKIAAASPAILRSGRVAHRGDIVKGSWPGRMTGTPPLPQIPNSQTKKAASRAREVAAGSVKNHNRDADGSLEWSSPQQPRGAEPEAPRKGAETRRDGQRRPCPMKTSIPVARRRGFVERASFPATGKPCLQRMGASEREQPYPSTTTGRRLAHAVRRERNGEHEQGWGLGRDWEFGSGLTAAAFGSLSDKEERIAKKKEERRYRLRARGRTR